METETITTMETETGNRNGMERRTKATTKMDRGGPSFSNEDAGDEEDVGGIPLKRGPWGADEDAILKEYVNKHGEGNWNAVHKNTELRRCGKSCRLRWTNHLRPELKKCPFTEEEMHKIIQLHYNWGNKWAKIALELPGRTDNEIKNFWNTRIKKLNRTGQPIYPLDICGEISQGQEGQNNDILQNEDMQFLEFPQATNLDLPKFTGLDYPNGSLELQEMLPHPSDYFNSSSMDFDRYFQIPQSPFPDLYDNIPRVLPSIIQHGDLHFDLACQCDTYLKANNEMPIDETTNSNAVVSHNSVLRNNEHMNFEFPSLRIQQDTVTGFNAQLSAGGQVSNIFDMHREFSNQADFSFSDPLIQANWFDGTGESVGENRSM